MATYRGAENGNVQQRIKRERQRTDTLRFLRSKIVEKLPAAVLNKFKVLSRTRQ